MTTLDEIRRAAPENICVNLTLRRADDVQASYEKHMKYIEQTYKSVRDYVLIKMLGYGGYSDGVEKKVICFNEDSGVRWRLKLNDFPYDLAPGLEHYCLWTNAPDANIETCRLRLKEMFEDNNDYHFFENVEKNKTIPDVFHVHVICRLVSKERITRLEKQMELNKKMLCTMMKKIDELDARNV